MSQAVSTNEIGESNESSDVISKIVQNVRQIVVNIFLGDCPYPISCAMLFCRMPHNLSAPGAVVVYCLYDRASIDRDLKLFRYLTANDTLTGPSNDLFQLLTLNYSVNDAITKLINDAASVGIISDFDVARLKSKYLVWMNTFCFL